MEWDAWDEYYCRRCGRLRHDGDGDPCRRCVDKIQKKLIKILDKAEHRDSHKCQILQDLIDRYLNASKGGE